MMPEAPEASLASPEQDGEFEERVHHSGQLRARARAGPGSEPAAAPRYANAVGDNK